MLFPRPDLASVKKWRPLTCFARPPACVASIKMIPGSVHEACAYWGNASADMPYSRYCHAPCAFSNQAAISLSGACTHLSRHVASEPCLRQQPSMSKHYASPSHAIPALLQDTVVIMLDSQPTMCIYSGAKRRPLSSLGGVSANLLILGLPCRCQPAMRTYADEVVRTTT